MSPECRAHSPSRKPIFGRSIFSLSSEGINTLEHIGNRLRTTVVSRQLEGLKTKTTVTAVTTVAVDKLLNDCSDLINPSFREWYCKMFYKIDHAAIYEMARQARSGRSPLKYFSFLLRRAAG